MFKYYKRAKKAGSDYLGHEVWILETTMMVLTNFMPFDFFWSRMTANEAEYDARIWAMTGMSPRVKLVTDKKEEWPN